VPSLGPPCLQVCHQSHLLLLFNLLHPFIDESYDDRYDDYRVFDACREIAKLCTKSHEELADLVTELQPIFDHNFKNVLLHSIILILIRLCVQILISCQDNIKSMISYQS